MLPKAMVVIAIVFVLGSSGLSTSAFARSDGHGGGGSGRGDSFRGKYFRGGFGGISGDSFGGNGNRTGGLHGGLRGYENRDVWGHCGTYYGPMIPAI
jgi:hypothetical protein